MNPKLLSLAIGISYRAAKENALQTIVEGCIKL